MQDKKRTLREDLGILWRGIKICHEIFPRYWGCCILNTLVNAFTPYFGIYMSAQLVNELAGNCDLHRLLTLAFIAAGGGFLLSMANRLLAGWRNLLIQYNMDRNEGYMINAQNKLQFEHLENPEVTILRAQIFQDHCAIGGGLLRITWSFPEMAEQVLNIIFSVSLTVSMFTLKADGYHTGIFGFFNSPWSAIMLVVLITVNALCAVKVSSLRTARSEDAVKGLAELNARSSIFRNQWGVDMILFDLNRLVLEEFRRYHLRPSWVSKREKIGMKYGALSTMLNAALDISVFLFTAVKAFIGTFGIGNFLMYQGAIRRFIGAVSDLGWTVGVLRYNNRYLLQLYQYLDLPNKMYQGTLAVEKRDDIDYEIEFKDVSFKYPRTDTWVLRHVNMKLKIGNKIAIVGENGSGKTTFIKLLCRLYDPTEGKILLNGIDITRYRYEEYLGLFSVAFQDYKLFAFPIGDNVAADLDYDTDRIRNCLIRTGMGEKLADLDREASEKGRDGLSLAIGKAYDNEGIELSGGERQKVALARALYKDAPFVILDEPTSALDPIAEAEVYENFNRIAQDKTSVFISHRLSSCRFCDTIVVFDKGQLVQEGAHDKLVVDTEGKYSQLWEAQAKYYTK